MPKFESVEKRKIVQNLQEKGQGIDLPGLEINVATPTALLTLLEGKGIKGMGKLKHFEDTIEEGDAKKYVKLQEEMKNAVIDIDNAIKIFDERGEFDNNQGQKEALEVIRKKLNTQAKLVAVISDRKDEVIEVEQILDTKGVLSKDNIDQIVKQIASIEGVINSYKNEGAFDENSELEKQIREIKKALEEYSRQFGPR